MIQAFDRTQPSATACGARSFASRCRYSRCLNRRSNRMDLVMVPAQEAACAIRASTETAGLMDGPGILVARTGERAVNLCGASFAPSIVIQGLAWAENRHHDKRLTQIDLHRRPRPPELRRVSDQFRRALGFLAHAVRICAFASSEALRRRVPFCEWRRGRRPWRRDITGQFRVLRRSERIRRSFGQGRPR